MIEAPYFHQKLYELNSLNALDTYNPRNTKIPVPESRFLIFI